MLKLVSVVVPIYNVKDYVERCLETVLKQTYQNLEIILVNDGSTDGSELICKKYKKMDSRVVLINQENAGLSVARNSGIDASTGDYICFVDSDDWLEKDFVSSNLQILEEKQVSISVCGYYISDDLGDAIEAKGFLNSDIHVFNTDRALYLLTEDVSIKSHAWDKMYKRDLFDCIRFPVGKNYEDIFVMHELFFKCDKIAVTLQPKYHYYVRNNSIARNYKTKNILDYFEAEFTRLRFFQKHNFKELETLQNTKMMELLLSYYPKFKKGSMSTEKYMQDKVVFLNYVEQVKSLYFASHRDFTELKYVYMYRVYKNSPTIFKIISPLVNNMLGRIKKSKQKNNFKRLLYKEDEFKVALNNYKGVKKTILIGLPEYDNLGDIAIGYAEINFLSKHLPVGYKLLCITENNFFKYFSSIKNVVTQDDIIFIQGGGNFGNQYPDQEKLRRKILDNFTNLTILCPSTFFMTNKSISGYAKYYSSKNLILFARERYSYELMSVYFKNKCYLVPDMVLSTVPELQAKERKGIALCFRFDMEKSITREQVEQIKAILFEYTDMLDRFDTCISQNVSINDYKVKLYECWNEVAKHKLIITDKLHMMIFCVITKTPCIALSNYNHKIKGVYEYLKDLNYIRFCDSEGLFRTIIDELLNLDCNRLELLNLNDSYNQLRKILEGVEHEKIY